MNFPADLIPDGLFSTLPVLGAYIQTHYRFKLPFSRYFQREPELIFDAPWRLEPGQTPTIFLVIKDAHDYPLQLNSVEIKVKQHEQTIHQQSWTLDREMTEREASLEFELTDCPLSPGDVEVFPTLSYTINGKTRELLVDNYLRIGKPPLRIRIAESPLPKLANWFSGDVHLHSSLTDDQIEFGAPLKQIQKSAELFGLDFVTLTDHSYDLDDHPHDYLQNDPDLVKWKTSRSEIKKMNENQEVTLIPAEEISVANAKGENVHLLHYNDDTYFPGSGDGAENWLNLTPELSIQEVLEQRSKKTASVAAHPVYKVPLLQRLLLKRGFWDGVDHEQAGLNGAQILNGTPASEAFQESRQLWIQTLLNGHRLSAYGGSDAHGNFNRNWHIKLPMWSLGFHDDQIFGQARTLLRSTSKGREDLIQAMQAGRTALSTGPVAELQLQAGKEVVGIGDTLSISAGTEITLLMNGFSTEEFGSELDVTVYFGDLEAGVESILQHETGMESGFELQLPFTPKTRGYFRLEMTSEGYRWPGLYLSSPIWIDLN